MIRPWQFGIAFGLCLALVLAAMGWVSWTALKLDHAQVQARQAELQARRQAAFEEDVRLALWRMDSALAPLIARENSRPYFAWNSFYPAERAYANMFGNAQQGEVLIPSPLLASTSPDVLLYFQVEPGGELSSPQVPRENVEALARVYQDPGQAAECAKRLADIHTKIDRPALLAALPAEPLRMDQEAVAFDNASRSGADRGGKGSAMVQRELSAAEYQARARNIQQAVQVGQTANSPLLSQSQQQAQLQQALPLPQHASSAKQSIQSAHGRDDPYHVPPAQTDQVAVGMMKPLWTGDLLLLARHVQVGGQSYVQGCWLDWPAIRQSLLTSVQDVLPQAQLEPVKTEPASDSQRSRVLAALPARLLPGDAPPAAHVPTGETSAEPVQALTPIRISLLLAWACVLLAAAAVGLLLVGTLNLSERRATFVSSVTHELRTPLTTLRMYTEMLAGGMISDDAKRRRYFDTLQREADRLGHLVENVLAYARLERGGKRNRVETLNLRELLDRAGERLASRCAQGTMQLSVNLPDWAERASVRADLSAVEQILFNLVDNACKYAAGGANPCVQVTIDTDGQWAFVRVRDFGPGINPKAARRLFRPFSKSDKDAAASAPGVGLGLALSRRLAREMKGDLRLEPGITDGASFVLTLPMVQCCNDQSIAKEV